MGPVETHLREALKLYKLRGGAVRHLEVHGLVCARGALIRTNPTRAWHSPASDIVQEILEGRIHGLRVYLPGLRIFPLSALNDDVIRVYGRRQGKRFIRNLFRAAITIAQSRGL